MQRLSYCLLAFMIASTCSVAASGAEVDRKIERATAQKLRTRKKLCGELLAYAQEPAWKKGTVELTRALQSAKSFASSAGLLAEFYKNVERCFINGSYGCFYDEYGDAETLMEAAAYFHETGDETLAGILFKNGSNSRDYSPGEGKGLIWPQHSEQGPEYFAKLERTYLRRLGIPSDGKGRQQILEQRVSPINLTVRNNSKMAKDISQIARVKSVESIWFQRSCINDKELAQICKMPRIRRLELSARKLSNRGLAALASAAMLEELSIGMESDGDDDDDDDEKTDKHITEEGIEQIARVKGLRKLSLDFKLNENVLLNALSSLPLLSVVSLDSPTPSQLRALKGCKSLKEVCLSGSSVNASSMRELANLKTLEKLDLDGTCVEPKDLSLLSDLSNLRELNLRKGNGSRYNTKDWIMVCKFIPSLQVWNGNVFCGDAGELQNLSENLAGIKLLVVGNFSENVDSDLILLSKFSKLENLHIEANMLHDKGLRSVSQNESLAELNLSCPVTGEAFDNGFSQLKKLKIYSSCINNKGLQAIGRLTQLEDLSLVFTDWKKGKEDFSPISKLQKLRSLEISNAAIGDESLPHILKLKNLKRLNLARTQFSLAAMEKLENTLAGCRVTPSVKQIKAAMERELGSRLPAAAPAASKTVLVETGCDN